MEQTAEDREPTMRGKCCCRRPGPGGSVGFHEHSTQGTEPHWSATNHRRWKLSSSDGRELPGERGGPAARSLPEDIVSGLPEVSPEGALVNPVAMSGTGRLKQHNCVCVSIMGCSLLLGSHGGPGVSTEITVIGGENRDINLKGHQPAKVKAAWSPAR